jgi:hypothetical protein
VMPFSLSKHHLLILVSLGLPRENEVYFNGLRFCVNRYFSLYESSD